MNAVILLILPCGPEDFSWLQAVNISHDPFQGDSMSTIVSQHPLYDDDV
jgi:hypothetical protein